MRFEGRMRRGGGSIGMPRLLDSAAQKLCIFGLTDDNFRVRHLLCEHARYALQGSAGAISCHPIMKRLSLEVLNDLTGGRTGMNVSIGLILELTGQKPSVRCGEFARLSYHSHGASRCRRQHDFRAQEAHEPAALDTKLLRHRHDQRIALLRAYHGEPDASVAARRLDDSLSGLELPRLFGRLDDAKR